MRSDSATESTIRSTLERAVSERVSPGLALIVGSAEQVLLEAYAGRLDYDADAAVVGPSTVYDLSSLTKPLATAALLTSSIERGDVDLRTKVADLLPEFAADADATAVRRAVTVEHLLAHSSGLPAHRRYFEAVPAEIVGTREAAARIIGWALQEPLEASPGTRAVYSDLGFMLLGKLVEVVSGARLEELASSRLFTPLGLASTGFRPLDSPARAASARAANDARTIAPCGVCAWRGGLVRGVVQDENAYAMGGIAGHAGLFSTVREVHLLVAQWVLAWLGRTALFGAGVVRRLWTSTGPAGSTWALGWDTPSAESSSAGSRISRRSVGHLGFTGTSIWIDLQRGLHVVLLTNRLQPDYTNTAIRGFRPLLHDVIFDAFA